MKRHLVEALGQFAADPDRRRILHEHGDAGNLRELPAQRLHDAIDIQIALVGRFQVEEHPAEVRPPQTGGTAGSGEEPLHVGVVASDLDHLILALGEFGKRRALRGFRDREDLTIVLVRDEPLGDDIEHPPRGQQDRQIERHNGAPVLEHPEQAPLVQTPHPIEGPLGGLVGSPMMLLARRSQKSAAEHGSQGQGDDSRDENSGDDGHRELLEEAADNAPHEQQRDEHRRQGHGHGENRKPDLLGAMQRRGKGRFAHFHVTDDVLQHDDGVVDDEPDAQRQGQQGQVVHRVPQQVHDAEGADDAERQGQTGDDRRGEIAQEQEDHQDHQRQAQQQGELNLVHRLANGGGPVVEDVQLDRRRQVGLERGQELADGIANFDRVGAGLALNGQDDRGLMVRVVVVPRACPVVLDPIDGAADVPQADRGAVPVRHDDAVVGVGLEKLAAGLNGVGALRTVDRPHGQVDVGAANGGLHLVDADPADPKTPKPQNPKTPKPQT